MMTMITRIQMATKRKLSFDTLLTGLTIQDKESGEYIPFDPEASFPWAQMEVVREVERQFNSGKPVRIIVLKARQLGISTITASLVFLWSFMRPGTTSLIIAHESDLSQSLFEKTQINWENWPLRPLYTTKHMSMQRMSWEETRSQIRIATAKNIKSGRGRTIHFLHGSECAFWDDADTLMSGLNNSVPNAPGSVVIMESTANGVGGWFYDEWHKAEAGESDYIPLFFAWWRHPEYSQPAYSINPHSYETTDPRVLSRLDRTEKDLLGVGATLENLEWRRWALKNLLNNDEEKFRQEYPATPHEAFLTSGVSVFSQYHTLQCYDQWKGAKGDIVLTPSGKYQFKADPMGNFTMFRPPADNKSWGKYVVVGDPTHTTRGDRACIQVLNCRTMEQVGVWHGHIDPINFGDKLMELGYFYNTAVLNMEVDGPGYGTISRVMTMGYPSVWTHRWADKAPGKISGVNYGWLTNYARKNWAIAMLKWLITEHSTIFHDKTTFLQLQDYAVLNQVGEMGNSSPQGFDDAVMAYAIAVITAMTEQPEEYVDDGRPMGLSSGGQMLEMGSRLQENSDNNGDLFGVPPWEAFPNNDNEELG